MKSLILIVLAAAVLTACANAQPNGVVGAGKLSDGKDLPTQPASPAGAAK